MLCSSCVCLHVCVSVCGGTHLVCRCTVCSSCVYMQHPACVQVCACVHYCEENGLGREVDAVGSFSPGLLQADVPLSWELVLGSEQPPQL